jgi:hypothetical protein
MFKRFRGLIYKNIKYNFATQPRLKKGKLERV